MDLVPGPFSAASIASLEALSVANIDDPSTELNARLGVTTGARVVCYQAIAGINEYTVYYFDSTSSATVAAPYIINAMTSGQWVAVGGKYVNGVQYMANGLSVTLGLTVTSQGAAIAGGLQVSGVTSASSVSTVGGYTSTVATGTAPFTASSTTVCPNLNVSQLLGGTWAIPGTIGSTTKNTGAFTTLSSSGLSTLNSASITTTLGVTGASTMGALLTVSLASAFSIKGFNTVASSSSSGSFLGLNEDDGAAMASGDRLGGVLVGGARDGSGTINSSSGFSAFTTEAWSSTACGSNLVFHTVANTTTARVDRMTIGQDGLVAIVGAATVGTTLGVTGTATMAGVNATSIGATTPGTGAFTTLTSSSTTGFAGITTVKPAATVGLIIDRTDAAAERGMTFTNSGLGTKYNFKIACNTTVNDAFEILPSTAAGGGTYSTPALYIAGATGLTTIASLAVTGAATVGTTLGVTGAVTCSYLTMSGFNNVANTFCAGGVNGTVIVHSTGSIYDFAVQDTGGTARIGIPTGTPNVAIPATTASTSKTTGALQVGGGLAAVGNIVSAQGLGYGVASTASAGSTSALSTSSACVQIVTGSSTHGFTLPAANAFGTGVSVIFVFKNRSSGNVTLTRAGSDTIDGATTATLAGGLNTGIMLVSDGSAAWEII